MATQFLPPIPEIEGDRNIMADVYMDPESCTCPTNDEYGDVHRLCELGKRTVELVVSSQIFVRKPLASVEDLKNEHAKFISEETIDTWIEAYNLKNLLRRNDTIITDEKLPEALRRFFFTLVGAVYFRNGFPAVQRWIGQLVEPGADVAVFGPVSPSTRSSAAPPAPDSAPPPLPPDNPAVDSISLSSLNEIAQKKGVVIDYNNVDERGPPHDRVFSATASIKGTQHGAGEGKSKKAAKEAAGRDLYRNLQW